MTVLKSVVRGFGRSLTLVGLTILMPLLGAAVVWGGSLFAYSLSHGSHAALPLKVLAWIGETLLVLVWLAAVLWMAHALTSRALAKAARRRIARWLGQPIEVTYREPAAVTRMANGFWWDGHEYQKSEREARRQAKSRVRIHDPQVYWDGLWCLVAGVTVLPVAAVPLLGLVGGLALITITPYGLVALAAGIVSAPYAWQIVKLVQPGPVPSGKLGRRIRELEAIRADLTETQAAELERIERGLHDGAQARLVAMGMSMQAAQRLVDADPEAAKQILVEARASSAAALAELRSLVRGINPPVLIERGLVDAVRALALDAPIPTTVDGTLPKRPERPLESAIYFAVSELMTNVAKHAHAHQVLIEFRYGDRTLSATVADDGIGGASASAGSGLAGIERRLAAFGGRLEVESPAGGPTRVTVAVPCELS